MKKFHIFVSMTLNLCLFFCRSGEELRGGGVGIYVRNDHVNRCDTVNVEQFCKDKILEACAVQIALVKVQFVLICIYRRPSMIKADIDLFIEHLVQLLDFATTIKETVVVIGDTNICRLTADYRLERMEEVLLMFNLENVINDPTRYGNTRESSIDNIFTNFQKGSYRSEIIQTALSDHCGISLSLNKAKFLEKNFVMRRYFTSEAILSFKYFLMEQDWSKVYRFKDADDAFSTFHRILITLFNLSFKPKKSMVRSNTKMKVSDPRLHALKLKIITLSELLSVDRKNTHLKSLLSQCKTSYHHLLIDLKKYKINQLISSSENKTKTSWQIINQETRLNKISHKVVNIKNNNGEFVSTAEACQMFNKHFLEVPKNIMSNLNLVKGGKVIDRETEWFNKDSIVLHFVSAGEISKIIKMVKGNHSAGYDEISGKLLKEISEYLVEPLVYCINLCIFQGVYPSSLKIAKVVPIYKKNDPGDISNYRPVSLLPTISKIFEYVLLNRLVPFCNRYNIFSSNQHGFLKGMSTIGAVRSFTERVIENMEQGKVSLAVFLDLTAAFDCPLHDLILKKLYNYGMRGVANDMIKSYLSGRKQYVSLNSCSSNACDESEFGFIEHGVPQGSILGPFLFLIYVNSLVQDNILYCDDTTCVTSDSNLSNVEIALGEKVNVLTQDLSLHNLAVNPVKTSLMLFKPINVENMFEPSVALCGVNLECVQLAKLLGMHIDSNFTWEYHVNAIIAKMCSGLFVLKSIAPFTTREVAISVYHALIHSHINYGIILWGACSSYHLQRVLKIQKRAIRIICHLSYRDPVRHLFKVLNILSVVGQYIFELCIFAKENGHKTKLGDNHKYSTRTKNQYVLPIHRTKRFESMPSYKGLKCFNHLPLEIRSVQPRSKFRLRLKTFLIEKSFYSLDEFWRVNQINM